MLLFLRSADLMMGNISKTIYMESGPSQAKAHALKESNEFQPFLFHLISIDHYAPLNSPIKAFKSSHTHTHKDIKYESHKTAAPIGS